MDSIEKHPRLYNFARAALDWILAIGLTVLGFWLISWWRTPEMPSTAPEWELNNLEGDVVRLSDFSGQTVVLNFWATWCGPCKMEIPEFRRFVSQHPDVPVLGIAVDGTTQKLKQFSKQYEMNYPILLADSTVQRAYNVSSLPMTVIVGPDGEVKDVHVGVMMAAQLDWLTK